MKLAKRIIAVVGAPALLAGFVLAGSAGATPALAAPKLPYTVTFTATAIVGTSKATVTSTSCTLKAGGGNNHSCFLAGSAMIGGDQPATGNFAITGDGTFGPVSLSLTQASSNCADGTALVILPKGPETVNAKGTITNNVTQTGPNTFTIHGTVKVGPNVTGCSTETTTTVGT